MIVAKVEALQKARILRGLSKTELAYKIGVNHSVIVRAEQSKGVSPKTSKAICDFLGVPFDSIFNIVEIRKAGGEEWQDRKNPA